MVFSVIIAAWLLSLIIVSLFIDLNKKNQVINLNKEKIIIDKITEKKLKDKLINCAYGYIWALTNTIAYLPTHSLRNTIYKNVFKIKLGDKSTIYHGCEIISPWKLEIGDGSIVGIKNIIDARAGIYIGKNVNLSHEVNLWTMQHDVNDLFFSNVSGSIYISDYAWIGNRVIILPGVKIGKGAVIAAGSIVTKDVEDFSIYAGVPARRIGARSENLKYKLEIIGFI